MNAPLDSSSPLSISSRSFRTAATIVGLASAALIAVACGPAGQPAGSSANGELERFEFIRGRMGVVRVDTNTGQVWTVPLSGDGGWEPLGDAPGLAGEPTGAGRFRVMNVAQRSSAASRFGKGSDASAVMVRVDRRTGRGWFLESEDATTWTPVGDDAAAPTLAETETSGGATPSAPAVAPATGTTPPSTGTSTSQATGSRVLDENSPEMYPILTGDQLGVTPEEKQKTLSTLHAARTKQELPHKMRLWAVRQLGQVDPDLAVPELIEVLDDPDSRLVAEAVRQLGQIGRASSIPPILRLQNHSDADVRRAVSEVVVEVN
jgi:hypothetical protein